MMMHGWSSHLLRYIWSSSADGSFTIVEDSENEPLGRGTLIKIHLKPEALEYIEVRHGCLMRVDDVKNRMSFICV
jgi:HSP90 family molecular chaperone